MADSELPIDSEHPDYDVGITLEGRNYIFHVRWNVRDSSWYFDILDPSKVDERGKPDPIVRSVRLVLGVVLARRCLDPRMPTGMLFASDVSGDERDAGLNDLGTRVKVYYRPAADIV